MTWQGHPYPRFREALATGNARIAEAAARDLQHVGPADALDLVLLYRDDPERYERAAARWIARLVAERPKIHLSEIELAAAGFREALHSERGVEALRSCLGYGSGGGGGAARGLQGLLGAVAKGCRGGVSPCFWTLSRPHRRRVAPCIGQSAVEP
jgi:hypothetical protein